MNGLILGTGDKTQLLIERAVTPFLLIDDGPIADAFAAEFKAAQFDIATDHFNPFPMAYREAREFAALVYGDKDLMTYRDGKRALTRMAREGKRLDQLPAISQKGYEDAKDTIDDLLLSPVISNVLCNRSNFSFLSRSHALNGDRGTNYRSVIVRLNRAEIGDFDAFLLGNLFITQHQGQIIIPDYGFYGRDISLMRQNRLLAGVDRLADLPKGIAVNHFSERVPTKATWEDAEVLAMYAGLKPDHTRADNPYNNYIQKATADV